jgi:hypothetical protein
LAFQTDEGLSLKLSGIVYLGYSYRIGILFLLADTVVLGILGLYLDQVIPS